jgi:hypothetical protein
MTLRMEFQPDLKKLRADLQSLDAFWAETLSGRVQLPGAPTR